MALGGYNRDGAAGTLRDMQQAARPQPAEDDLPARVALHDDVLGQHSAQLADHGDRLDKLEAGFGHGTDGGPAGDRDTDHDGA
jgi:hypothetical protein